MNAGDSQAEIARRLGNTRPYVTYATALIDAPDWLLTLYRQRRCRGLLELYELRQLHARCPDTVRQLESSDGPITRQRIAAAKADAAIDLPLQTRAASDRVVDDVSKAALATKIVGRNAAPIRRQHVGIASAPTSVNSTHVLLAELDGRTVEVIVDDAPPRDGDLFVRAQGEGGRRAAPASSLRLIRLEARSSR